jgi:hypothetical protein
MGQLKQLITSRDVPLDIKLHMDHIIPVNAALWGCKTWAMCDYDTNRLNVFHHCSIRMILGISVRQVRGERIRNKEIRRRFFNIPLLLYYAKGRTLKYIGKTMRGEDEAALQKRSSLCTVTPPKHVGGQQTTHRDLFCRMHSINHTYNPEGCAPQNLGKARTRQRQRGMGVVSTILLAEHQQIGSRG